LKRKRKRNIKPTKTLLIDNEKSEEKKRVRKKKEAT
jgi:hypothetical protein